MNWFGDPWDAPMNDPAAVAETTSRRFTLKPRPRDRFASAIFQFLFGRFHSVALPEIPPLSIPAFAFRIIEQKRWATKKTG
jgi:hypothetical protein